MRQSTIPVFYTERMVSDEHDMMSPSPFKPRQVADAWRSNIDFPLKFIEPTPATLDELCLAHQATYVRSVLACQIPNGFSNTQRDIALSLPYTSGSMLSAARYALKHGGVACSPTSGFHHACYDHSGIFCTFNGLMVTALALHKEGLMQRVGILDFDYHYGNGTDDIIKRLSIDWVKNITNGVSYTGKADSFMEMIPSLVSQLADCDLILYQAGGDQHIDDPLGGFLTTEQMKQRDAIVFKEVKSWGIPLVWNLAGGYQIDELPNGTISINKVLALHDNTMDECVKAYC